MRRRHPPIRCGKCRCRPRPPFRKTDNCASAAVTTAAMPWSPLRRLALDLRFSGRRHQSLTLVPGASGAATTTSDLPGNVCRLCSRSLSFCPHSLTGGASAMVGWQSNGCVLWLFLVGVVHAGINAQVMSFVCSLYQMCASFTK